MNRWRRVEERAKKKKSPNKAQRFDVSIAHKNLSKKKRE
jgi:hypothetical protein